MPFMPPIRKAETIEIKENREREKKVKLELIKLVRNGETLGIRVCLRNTSDRLCVDTDYENLNTIQYAFSEDEIKWLKEEELSLQDGTLKTSTDQEYFSMEVENEGLLSNILQIERDAEEFKEDSSKEGNSWFYTDLYYTPISSENFVEFIKKWYFIRYAVKSSNFSIHLESGGDDCYYKALVSYSCCGPFTEENKNTILSLLKMFNTTDKPIYLLSRDTYDVEDWSIYNLDSYIQGGEPICYKFEEDEYNKYIEKVQLVYTDLTECADSLGCDDEEFDYLLEERLFSRG